MGDPIKIVVTAETAQAASALRDFVNQGGSGLNELAAAGQKATSAMTEFRHGTMAGYDSTRAMSSAVILLGGTHFPQLSTGIFGSLEALRAMRSTALLTGASLSSIIPIAGVIAAAVGAGALIWHEFSSAEAEAAKATKDLEDALGRLPELLEQINTLHKAGVLGPGAAGEFADYLTGRKKLYKDSQGNLTQNPTEQVEGVHYVPIDKGMELQQVFTTQNLPEASKSEIQAWVEKQLSGEGGLKDTREKAVAELRTLLENDQSKTLAGIAKEKQAVTERYDAEIKKIKELQTAAGPREPADLAAESKAKIDALESAKQGELGAIDDKEDLAVQKSYDDAVSEELELEKEIGRLLAEDKKKALEDVVNAQEKLRAALEQQKFEVQGNPFTSDTQKEGATAGILWQQIALAKTEQERLGYEKELQKIMVSQSFTGQWAAMVTDLQNMNNLAKETSQAFATTFNAAISSVSSNLTKVIEGTETWRKALLKIADTIVTDIIQGIIQMGVRWISTEVMTEVFGKSLQAAGLALAAGESAAYTAIWMPAAIASSIASFGASASVGEAAAYGAVLSGFAEGGRPPVGQPVVVGEEGKEIFVPDSAGTIIPADKTATMMGAGMGGGSATVGDHKVNIHFYDKRPHPKDWAFSSEGENWLIDTARKHRLKIGIGT